MSPDHPFGAGTTVRHSRYLGIGVAAKGPTQERSPAGPLLAFDDWPFVPGKRLDVGAVEPLVSHRSGYLSEQDADDVIRLHSLATKPTYRFLKNLGRP